VFSDAIIGIIAAMAQQERIRISERTKAGLTRARAQGVISADRAGWQKSGQVSRTTLWRRAKAAGR
jgi:DNA invertase Pin-like site-specific DNA recombinase